MRRRRADCFPSGGRMLGMKITTVAVALFLVAAASFLPAQQPLDKAAMDRWMKELSNWGRWGKTDQMGTVNLITPAKRRNAAALVKEGYSVSLSRVADTVKAIDNARPFGHQMISSSADPDPMFAMDTYTISFHGTSLTHFDALSHMFYEGKV